MSKKVFKEKCRACLGQTKAMQSLTNLADAETPLTFAELLEAVVNINVKDEKDIELPQQICAYCSRKLKSSHTFIKKVHEVNERLWSLVNPSTVDEEKLDCLVESEIDIETCLEIKMESCEEHDGDPSINSVEIPSVKLVLPLKTELNEDPVGKIDNIRSTVETQITEISEKCNLLDKLNIPNTDLATTETGDDFKKIDEASDVKTLSNLHNNVECLNQSDIKMDITESDSDDDKCLASIKAAILGKHNSTSKVLNESTARHNRRKINKKINKPTQKDLTKKNDDEDLAVPCQKCNKIFNNSKELSTHLRNAHIPQDQRCACPVCNATFTRPCSMHTHMKTFHESEYFKIISPPKEKSHQCEKCHRKYTSIKYLKYHIKLKHNQEGKSIVQNSSDEQHDSSKKNQVPDEQNGSSKKNQVRPLCSICGASVCNGVQLIIHMRRHTGERPFKCELCDRSFPQKTELNNHRRIHTGEKPYKCKICDKAFRVSTKLSNHMRSHTDERPYKCSQCERSFKYSKDLNIHNRIHTGERPYSCNVCGNTFTQSNSLKTHRVKLGHLENTI